MQLRISWGWAGVDREIADRAARRASAASSARAEQLLRSEERGGIAAVLRNIVDAAEEASGSRGAIRREDAAAILAARGGLAQLIDLLRSDAPMTAAAVARTELLACERHSPLLSPHGAQPIIDALEDIRAANAPIAGP